MIRPSPDSFGRSRLLEFSRSPLLERNAPPPVGDELAQSVVANAVLGYGKFVSRDWEWYPTLRQRVAYDAEFLERVDSCGMVSLNPPHQFELNQTISAGFVSGLSGFRLLERVEGPRTATQLNFGLRYINDATQVQKLAGEVWTLEGQPVDLRLLAQGFWDACGLAAATPVQRPPLHTVAPVLFETRLAVNDDLMTIRELSRGLVSTSQVAIDSLTASSFMSPSVSNPNAVGDEADFVFGLLRQGLNLSWIRHVRHFILRGESQFGSIDAPFLTLPFAISCVRGFTEEYEYVTPPVLSSARLNDFPILTLNGALFTSIELRIIPPNATHVLLTC